MTTALLFVASGVLIIVASELFTNAVEWAGFRMRLASGATGSLLAALGTSLPEFVVPVVALATHTQGADSVAIGAVLGAPFLLLTLGAGITGLAVLTRRDKRTLRIPAGQARRDLGVFVGAFAVALVCSVLPRAARIPIGIVLLATYVAYVVATLRGGSPAEEMPEPLHFLRWRRGVPPPLVAVGLQLAVAIVLLVIGSQLFVTALDRAAAALHIPTLTLSIVVVPIATELPETMNSVLWVRSRDDTLAFGNVAGSATFQSCILAFIGLVFTTWHIGGAGLIGGLITLGTAIFLLALLFRGRAHGGWLALALVPWAAYVVAQVIAGGTLGGAGA
jgi:cation:H+ antiporter